jgi:hypothetical protein
MGWKRLLAYITGSVNQELLLRNEYVVTENRLLRQQIPGSVRLSNGKRTTLEARYHTERPHQGKGNVIFFPVPRQGREHHSPIQRRERLGGAAQVLHS